MSDPPTGESEIITDAMRQSAQATLDGVVADISAILRVATSDLSVVLEQGLRNAADEIAARREANDNGPAPTAA